MKHDRIERSTHDRLLLPARRFSAETLDDLADMRQRIAERAAAKRQTAASRLTESIAQVVLAMSSTGRWAQSLVAKHA